MSLLRRRAAGCRHMAAPRQQRSCARGPLGGRSPTSLVVQAYTDDHGRAFLKQVSASVQRYRLHRAEPCAARGRRVQGGRAKTATCCSDSVSSAVACLQVLATCPAHAGSLFAFPACGASESEREAHFTLTKGRRGVPARRLCCCRRRRPPAYCAPFAFTSCRTLLRTQNLPSRTTTSRPHDAEPRPAAGHLPLRSRRTRCRPR